MNITKGEWEITSSTISDKNSRFSISCNRENKPGNQIATVYQIDIPKEEAEANANLICEAGNIANQTGLSPKQLLEQRDELISTLSIIQNALEVSTVLDRKYWSKKALKALKKATK